MFIVHLKLTGTIPEKPYAQADLGLYSLMIGLKDAILIWGSGGSTEKARIKRSVCTISLQSKTERKYREGGEKDWRIEA